jgi:hypothetical protein
MKRFFGKLVLLLVLVIFFNAAVLFFYRQRNLSIYLVTDVKKHQILAEAASPRLIFIGGSSAAFGVDGSVIEEKLPFHVVNMGLHVDLGLQFMLNEVQPYLREGDVVILGPEYPCFIDLNGGMTLIEMLILNGQAIQYVNSFGQWKMLLSEFLPFHVLSIDNMMRDLINNHCYYCAGKLEIYETSSDAFDIYGDIKPTVGVHAGLRVDQLSFTPKQIGSGTQQAIDLMNRFNEVATRKGARVFFVLPPIVEEDYLMNKTYYQAFYALLRAQLDFPVLLSLDDSIYTREYFFDQASHLTAEGRVIRSVRISDALLTIVK